MKKIIILVSCLAIYVLLLLVTPILGKASNKQGNTENIVLFSENLTDKSIEYVVNFTSKKIYTKYNKENEKYFDKYKELKIDLFVVISSYDEYKELNDNRIDGVLLTDYEDINILENDIDRIKKGKIEVDLVCTNSKWIETLYGKIENFVISSLIKEEVKIMKTNESILCIYEASDESKLIDAYRLYFLENKKENFKDGCVLYLNE